MLNYVTRRTVTMAQTLLGISIMIFAAAQTMEHPAYDCFIGICCF
jgi:ABC-type dipeptide/oligopeptide/nickel transport system permease component